MMTTRRLLAVTALSALVLGVSACSPKDSQPTSGATTSAPTPSASASASATPTAQSGMDAQSGETPQSASVDKGNQAPEVDVTNNEARCDLTNLQPSIDSQQEAGGTTYVEIGFTNEGPSCWIDGFPQIIFSSGGSVISTAVREGEDPGNVYTIAQGGRVGVTLTAESTDGVDGCNPADSELVDIMPEAGTGATSLQLTLRVCQEMPSVSVSPFEPRS